MVHQSLTLFLIFVLFISGGLFALVSTASPSINSGLLRIKVEAIDDENATTTTASTTTSITPSPTTITAISMSTAPPVFTCTEMGKFPDPNDCTKYHTCAKVNGKWIDTVFSCHPGLIWCDQVKACYKEDPVKCPCSKKS